MSTGAAGMPAGPWVLVAGMHRSGTSAVAGALGALGFQTPGVDDRMDWPESNPEHWESLSMSVFNDDLLEASGGSWEAPPELPDGWPDDDRINRLPTPEAVASQAYPVPGPIVWKDPRLCLVLPYWRRFLSDPIAAVLIWRSPIEVSASLARRDGMDVGQGIALWEHYNRSALGNLEGVDTFVCSYERLLVDPRSLVEGLADWLGSLEQFRRRAPGWDVDKAVAGVAAQRQPGAAAGVATPGQPGAEPGGPMLLPEQRHLVGQLKTSEGGHRPLPPVGAGADSPWSTSVIRAHRDVRSREVDLLQKTLGQQLEYRERDIAELRRTIDALTDSTSWRVTRPLRSAAALLHRSGHRAAPVPLPEDHGH
jgi:hypothetical protein